MKKSLLMLIIIALLIMTAGCTPSSNNTPSNAPSTPSGTATGDVPDNSQAPENTATAAPSESLPSLAGSEEYRNTQYGFTIKYPIEWYYIDGTTITDDVHREAVEEVFGDKLTDMINDLGLDFSGILVYWFDYANASDDFIPSVNLNIVAAEGMTQNDLKLPANLAELQATLEPVYASMFNGFSVKEDFTGKTLGDNYVATFIYYAEIGGISLGQYQAFTVNGDDMYIFSLSTPAGILSESINTFEKMLTTLSFS